MEVAQYGFKACRKCGTVKYHDQFYLQVGGRSLAPYCKPCHSKESTKNGRRRYAESADARAKKKKNVIAWQKRHPEKWGPINRKNGLKFNHNLKPGDYKHLVTLQGDKCALCGTTDKGKHTSGSPHTSWSIDHCHKTGVVRGLLCRMCNLRLGCYEMLRDAIGLEAIEQYLHKSLI